MKKIIKINGMTCEHCKAAAEKALNSIDGVAAKVCLPKKQATVTLSRDVGDEAFKKVLDDAGFEMLSVTEKGL